MGPEETSGTDKQSQVAEQLMALNQAIECAKKVHDELRTRLQLVVMQGIEPLEKEPQADCGVVPLAHQIRGYVRDLQELNGLYSELIRAIQL